MGPLPGAAYISCWSILPLNRGPICLMGFGEDGKEFDLPAGQHWEAFMKVCTILSSVSAAFGLLTTSVLAQPQESWSAEGFKTPESALLDDARGVLYVSNWNGNP